VVGETETELPVTVPMPLIEIDVAPVTFQERVEDCPELIEDGLAVKELMTGGFTEVETVKVAT